MAPPEQIIQSTMHLNNFTSWNVDTRVYDAVNKTCFKYFLRIKKDVFLRQNWQMITALVDYYDCNINCFKFKETSHLDYHLDFGLEDIMYITGLPIDGIQVSLSFLHHSLNNH
jgi:hypothetical protein